MSQAHPKTPPQVIRFLLTESILINLHLDHLPSSPVVFDFVSYQLWPCKCDNIASKNRKLELILNKQRQSRDAMQEH